MKKKTKKSSQNRTKLRDLKPSKDVKGRTGRSDGGGPTVGRYT